MKVLKIFLVIILILVLGGLVYSAMAPKTFSANRSTVIQAGAASVFEEIADFNQWSAWSPWAKKDPNMEVEIEGSGVGHKMNWKSEHEWVGNGSQEIVELTENEHLRMELNFGYEPNYAQWTIEDMGDSCKVTWILEEQEIPFMGRAFMQLSGMHEALDADYVNGLASLKEVVEAKPQAPAFEIKTGEKDEIHYVGKVMDLTMEDLAGGAAHAAAYGEIGAFLGADSIQVVGMPLCFAHEWSETGIILNFALPVAGPVEEVPDGLNYGMVEAGPVVYGVHYGAYDGVEPSWNMIDKYVQDSGIEMRSYPYEEYLNDPEGLEPHEIMTGIVYPVK